MRRFENEYRKCLSQGGERRLVLGTLLTSLAMGSALASSADECRHVRFDQPLRAATSGVWDSNDEHLLVVDGDSYFGWPSLLSISIDGDLVEIARELEGTNQVSSIELSGLTSIRKGKEAQAFLMDRRQNFIVETFAEKFTGEKIPFNIESTQAQQETQAHLLAIDDWQPVHDRFVAFGDLQFPEEKGPANGRYGSAFVQFDQAGLRKIYTEPLELAADERNHYLGQLTSYIASPDGKNAFILRMSTPPSIGVADLDGEYKTITEKLPEPFAEAPRLRRNPEFTANLEGARQATEFLQLIEKASMPRGLYAWDGHLFLLGKGTIDDNRYTPWWLVELDPADGSEVARFRLPTTAAHLIPVPGNSTFALIEKAPVEPIGTLQAPYLETSSMTVFPMAWLSNDNRDSPLRVKAEEGSATDLRGLCRY